MGAAPRDRRVRATGRLGMQRGEHYALVPEEVLGSLAYNALPDFGKVVMFAVAVRYHGYNNGNLSLTIADARSYGVAYPWKLYAGLQLLRRTELILCTRQGRLERGRKLCSLYAVTWRSIDPPPEGVSYDSGASTSALASNSWARWEKPEQWMQTVREVTRKNHGRPKNPVSTTLGKGRSTTVGTEETKTDQPRWVKETSISVPRVVDTSETSPGVGKRAAAVR